VSASGQYGGGRGDFTLRFWDFASGRAVRIIKGYDRAVQMGNTVAHGSMFKSVVFSPNGRVVASASSGDEHPLKLWDPANGRQLRAVEGQARSVNSIAFSPDGRFIVSGGVSQSLTLWDAMSGRASRIIVGFNDTVQAVAFSPDGRSILSGTGEEEGS